MCDMDFELEQETEEVIFRRGDVETWAGIEGQHQYAYFETPTKIRLFPIE